MKYSGVMFVNYPKMTLLNFGLVKTNDSIAIEEIDKTIDLREVMTLFNVIDVLVRKTLFSFQDDDYPFLNVLNYCGGKFSLVVEIADSYIPLTTQIFNETTLNRLMLDILLAKSHKVEIEAMIQREQIEFIEKNILSKATTIFP